jgi:hypothetical protein
MWASTMVGSHGTQVYTALAAAAAALARSAVVARTWTGLLRANTLLESSREYDRILRAVQPPPGLGLVRCRRGLSRRTQIDTCKSTPDDSTVVMEPAMFLYKCEPPCDVETSASAVQSARGTIRR